MAAAEEDLEDLDLREKHMMWDLDTGRVVRHGGPLTPAEIAEKRRMRDIARQRPPATDTEMRRWFNKLKEMLRRDPSYTDLPRHELKHFLRDYPQSADAFREMVLSDNQLSELMVNRDGTPLEPLGFGGKKYRSKTKTKKSMKRRRSRRSKRS